MPTKIKLIVTDLDGTLLREDKTLSEHTISILKKCRENGMKVAFATGRGANNDKVVPKELFDGRIKANGAEARAGEEVVYGRMISFQGAKAFLKTCEEHDFKIILQSGDMSYSNFEAADYFLNNAGSKPLDISKHDMDFEKILLFPADGEFVEEHIPDELHFTISRENFISIMHKGATKGKALKALAEFWRIDSSEVVAFGDDLNDIDMLSFAGCGVAMGNAVEEVKGTADETTLSNGDDGVAEWIRKKIVFLYQS